MKTENESTIDLDLNSFTKDELISFIVSAHTKDITFNQLLVEVLSIYLEENNYILENDNGQTHTDENTI